MKFLLIVYLFASDGEFLSKDIHEVTDRAQCEQLAGEVARTHLNTQLQLQMHCISEEDYRSNDQ